MSITYRSQISTPLTWAQLDENFRTVEEIGAQVYDQYKAAQGYAEQCRVGIDQALQAGADARAYADQCVASVEQAQESAQNSATSAGTATTKAAEAAASAATAQSYAKTAVYTTTSGNAGANISVNLAGPTVIRATLVNDVTVLSLSGAVAAGETRQFTLILNQGVGSRLVDWDSNIRWADGRPPVLSFTPGAEDVISILVVGGLAYYYGFFNGGSFA